MAQSPSLPASAFLVLALQGSISVFVTKKEALISICAHLRLELALLHRRELCCLHLCVLSEQMLPANFFLLLVCPEGKEKWLWRVVCLGFVGLCARSLHED